MLKDSPWLYPVLCGAIIVAVAGCGGSGMAPVVTEVVPYTQEQAQIRAEAASARYHLREGDIIQVHFKYETDFNQSNVIVLPDGYINIKGLDGGIKAAGHTLEEVDQLLTRQFEQDIRNPALSVVIQDISDPEIYVLGMVRNPGLQRLPWKGVGMLQAISSAGGFREHANQSEVALMRATDEGFMLRIVDLSDVEDLGLADLAFYDIKPFDIIYVPKSALGNFKYLAETIFGSAVNITSFFWDIYAIANLDKIDRIVR